MDDKPTIAEEYFARLIATWHGQKMRYYGANATRRGT